MALNKITDLSETAASNIDIAGIGILGSNSPSNFDNALRAFGSMIAKVDRGTDPVRDTWTFADPADLTKRFRFDGGNVTAGQTRVVTIPDGDVTIPTGTLVTEAATQTLTSKTLTSPTITTPTLTLKQGASEAPTAEGDVRWDSDDNRLVIGDGAATQTFTPNPASTAAGDIEYYTAANVKARLAKGTAGQRLRMNSGATAPEWTSDGLLTSGTAQATTSGTAFDFSSIPSWVKRITILFSAVSLSGSDSILVQIGDSGGLETTSYDSGSSITNAGGTGSFASTSGFILAVDANTRLASGQMTLCNISGNVWIASHASQTSSAGATAHGGGSKTLSAVLDRLRITRTGTDTFDAGSVNIHYD